VVIDGFSPIIAGGDGSISEVINGVVRAADETAGDVVPVGILPLGSANDLIDNVSFPTSSRMVPG
jgi:diacylglycerol kinase family enzyme